MAGPSITNPANATPQWEACSPAAALSAGVQATTTAAVRMANFAFISQVTLHAPASNVAVLTAGASGVTQGVGYVMEPGSSLTLPIQNLNMLYLIGANTTDKLTWIGF